jgi:hypothetical protein
MRTIPSILGTVLFLSIAACSGAPDEPTASGQDPLNDTNGATGDSCTIDLPDGLKEPGTVSADGKCCSVLHTDKCYDIPKSSTGGKLGGGGVVRGNVGGAKVLR